MPWKSPGGVLGGDLDTPGLLAEGWTHLQSEGLLQPT